MQTRVVFWCLFVLSLALGSLPPSGAHAQSPPRRSPQLEAFEARITAEMERQNAEGARAFSEATAARDRGDLEAARKGFERARDLLPGSSHPLRRLCHVEVDLGQRERGIGHCRDAVAMTASSENLSGLALVLLKSDSMTEQNEAYELAERASKMSPDDELVTVVWAQAALSTGHETAFRSAVERLRRVAPDTPGTASLSAIELASRGEWSASEEAIDRAIALGAPAAQMEDLRSRIHEHQPYYLRAWRVIRTAGLAWILIASFLVIAGLVLSRAAARSARELPADPTGHARGFEASLRRAYRGLLWLTCAFYYASIPLVLGLVLLLGGGLILAFFALGTIPVKLVAIIAIITFTTLWAVVKSLFVRAKDGDPGTPLDLSEHPKLRSVLHEVASRVGTRPVDRVYLTPGTDIAVFERGGLWKNLRGAEVERCLVLGVGVLQGMRLVDFKAVLAHEYGHFQNEDTAGGGFALAVRRSVLSTAIALAQRGVATWYNPAWWFVRGFFLIFLRISHGASRLQEILADRWAAFSYGAEAFERGLRHAIARGAAFEVEANAKLNDVIRAKRPLANLYTYEPEVPIREGDTEEEVKKAIERQASPYDSHPAPLERIALVRRLQGTPAAGDDETEALELFEDRERLEREMTEQVRIQVVSQTGVRIPTETGQVKERRSAR